MAAGQLAGVMEGPLAADGGLCWGEGQGLGCEGWESGASPPSVATYKGLILAQEGELHFLGLVPIGGSENLCGPRWTAAQPLPLFSPQWATDDTPGQ